MPMFRVRITRITTEIFVYKSTAAHLEAAQVSAENSEPDADTMKAHTIIKRVGVTEIRTGGKN